MTGLPASLRVPRKPAGTEAPGFGLTRRVDRWWVAPSVQGTLFTILAGYLFFCGIVWTPLFGTRLRGRRLPVAALLAAHRPGLAAAGSSARAS